MRWIVVGCLVSACNRRVPLTSDGGLDVDAAGADAAIVDAAIVDAAVDASIDAPLDAPPDAPPVPLATLTVSALGSGLVESNDGTISCPPDCAMSHPINTQLVLAAQPAAESIFERWGGACDGSGPTCAVTLSTDRHVTARFGPRTVEWARLSPGIGDNRLDFIDVHPSGDLVVAGFFGTTVSLGGPVHHPTGANSNVIGRLRSTDGSHVWSRVVPQHVNALAVDRSGNVAIALGCNYAEVLDGVTYNGCPVNGLLLVVLDGETGAVTWATVVGRPGGASPNDTAYVYLRVAAAPDGDIVVAGTFVGPIVIGTQTFVAIERRGLLLVRLNGVTGAARWAVQIDGPGANDLGAMTVTAAGRIVVTGTASRSITLPGAPPHLAAETDSFIAALDGDGSRTAWVRMLGGGLITNLSPRDARLAVLGAFRSRVDLGTGPLDIIPTPHPDTREPLDAFVAVLDAESGAPAWARVIDLGYAPRGFGEERNLLLTGVAMLASGGVALHGALAEPLLVADLEVIQPYGFLNGIVLSLDAIGAATRVARFGGPGSSAINGLAVRGDVVWAVGGLTGRNDFGGVTLEASDRVDGAILRLRPAATAPQ